MSAALETSQPAPSPAVARATLIPLFLISAGAVGYEIALTRYFAVAKWSEYGYWVISIVMAGFALSGVAVTLFRQSLGRAGPWLQAVLPGLIVAAAAAGFHFTSTNPFNPLQLQNPATWLAQVSNIGLYYAALTPFFFLAGLYISLTFILHPREIGRVYGYDLIGAGFGAALVLVLMFVLHPFRLAPALLVPLALSALFLPRTKRWPGVILALIALAGGEWLLFEREQPTVNDFKAIYAPLHTPNAKVVAEIRSPRGHYQLLDDFTERADADVTNNADMMGLPGPPKTLGLYRDGTRIASIPRPGVLDVGYAPGALAAGPYALRPGPRVLLVGVSGGFRVAEALKLGAAHVDALEPEPVLRSAVVDGLGPSQKLAPDPRVRILSTGPVAAVRDAKTGQYDLVDISADFLDSAEPNGPAFASEAIASYLKTVAPDGMVSIPVSIRDFPVYALRMLATAREGLTRAGIAEPDKHVMVYRSAWGVRILLSPKAFDADRVAALKKFCDDRSFDVAYYPGMDVKAAREGLYNDLPSVSFATGEITAQGPDDSIADEALAVLKAQPTASAKAFNLEPVRLDRPFFYAILRLNQPDILVKRLEVLPQAEIGALVNLAVLAQAIIVALIVLLVPLLTPGRLKAERGKGGTVGPAVYFSALGLGFLFVEIFLIEKASFFLNDRTSAFSLVLTGMLVFSGIGSMLAGKLMRFPRVSVALAALTMIGLAVAMYRDGEPALLANLGMAWPLRAALVLAISAPVSVALGMAFPMGLSRVGDGRFLPWAWALNGAFSVVATPLANLVARQAGFSWVLYAGALFYLIAFIAFPRGSKTTS